MNRLQAWGKHSKIMYPEDVLAIRSRIPELVDISDAQIQDMYSYWSEDFFCASWLIIKYADLEHFRTWLLSEVTEGSFL